MHINDNVEASIARPSTQLGEVMKTALREVLTVRIYEALIHLIANWDMDGIKPIALHFRNITLSNPGAPVRLEHSICLRLTKGRDAVPLGGSVSASTNYSYSTGSPIRLRNRWRR
jgi:hypothetical protein